MDANRRDNPSLVPLAFLAVGSLADETFADELALMGLGVRGICVGSNRSRNPARGACPFTLSTSGFGGNRVYRVFRDTKSVEQLSSKSARESERTFAQGG